MYFTMTMKAKAAIMVVAVTMMVIFMTTASANEELSVRHRRGTLTQCSGGKRVPVRICVKTAEGNAVQSRGTDSDVRVRLNGANCHSPVYDLESSNDDFEQGDYDCYGFKTYDVGTPGR
ncbi:uncharacterized protein [Littorina saxatilis]|uniref:uncharacterized protein n=1 Tax=Littorina saxatilis TaxID=31220 RepID=UPI0038B55AA7